MSYARPLPGEDALRGFAERLSAFRETLDGEQRRLLDTMVAAALRPADPTAGAAAAEGPDVTPFWTYSGIRTSPNPSWYTGSGAAAWNNTSWGTAWLNYP